MASRCHRNDRSGGWCLFETLYPAPLARPFSKGLLKSYAIPCFCFSACSLPRIRARQRSLDFTRNDDTEWRFAQLSYWSLRRRSASSRHSILAFGAPLLQGATRIICNIVLSFSACSLRRIRVRQRSYGFASDDDTGCASSYHSIYLRRLQRSLSWRVIP